MKGKPYYLRKRGTKLLERVYWRRWNLDYTMRVLESKPASELAKGLLACWSDRIQRALKMRFKIAA